MTKFLFFFGAIANGVIAFSLFFKIVDFNGPSWSYMFFLCNFVCGIAWRTKKLGLKYYDFGQTFPRRRSKGFDKCSSLSRTLKKSEANPAAWVDEDKTGFKKWIFFSLTFCPYIYDICPLDFASLKISFE